MFGTLISTPHRLQAPPLTDKQRIATIAIVLYGLFLGWFFIPEFASGATDEVALELPFYARSYYGTLPTEGELYLVRITRTHMQQRDLAAYVVRMYLVDEDNHVSTWTIAGVQARFASPTWDFIGLNNKTSATPEELMHAADLLEEAMRRICSARLGCPAHR